MTYLDGRRLAASAPAARAPSAAWPTAARGPEPTRRGLRGAAYSTTDDRHLIILPPASTSTRQSIISIRPTATRRTHPRRHSVDRLPAATQFIGIRDCIAVS